MNILYNIFHEQYNLLTFHLESTTLPFVLNESAVFGSFKA